MAYMKAEPKYEPIADGVETIQDIRPRGFIFRSLNYTHVILIGVELVLAAVLVVGAVLGTSCQARKHLDGLSELGLYNTTMRFDNHSHLLRDSSEAKQYWSDLLDSGGVLSLNTKWALQQGLRASAASPTDPSHSIYQLDVFHALHCLVSIIPSMRSMANAWRTQCERT